MNGRVYKRDAPVACHQLNVVILIPKSRIMNSK